MKVVGRSLHPTPGAKTLVKLINVSQQTNEYILAAKDDDTAAIVVEQYVANVMLPPSLKEGWYKVLVARDNKSWVPFQGQLLEVRQNPMRRRELDISSYGCLPEDSRDDSGCILRAVAEAARSAEGGADVIFGAGVWNLSRSDIELP